MTANTSWYMFSKPSELQNALKLGTPQLLLSPYHLFRFEHAGDGRRQLLLGVEGQSLPEESNLKPLKLLSKQTKQSHVRVAQSKLKEVNTTSEYPDDAYRMTFENKDSSDSLSGWAFPLRHGQHALASVGMEQLPPHTPLAWALFHVPASMLHDVIANHLSLGRHSLRCSPAINNMHWLLVRQPEMYLFLKWKTEPNVSIYHSFPESESLMTPLGYRSPLASMTQLASDQNLLVMDLEGQSQWLPLSGWWQPSEIIQLPQEIQSQWLNTLDTPIKVSVRLRYIASETEEVPRLWRLHEETAQESLESLILDLPPTSRNATDIFIGQPKGGSSQEYWLKDNRPQVSAPLFSSDIATGWLALLEDGNLYIQSGHRLLPSLPATVWERDLKLSSHRYTFILPPKTQDEPPVIQMCNVSDFKPLAHYVDYQLASHTEELERLANATIFNILYNPGKLPDSRPVMEKKKPEDPFKATIPDAPKPPPVQTKQPDLKHQGPEAFRHPRGLFATLEPLRTLEIKIRKRKGRANTISPQDWLQLGRLYVKQYKEPSQNIYHWLDQAALSLDQVFRLDRRSDSALPVEAEMLECGLDLKGKSFAEEMETLDRYIQEPLPLLSRFAFRYRVRKLMDENGSEEEQAILRQRFYADLAQVEPELLVAEFLIFVEGAGLYLNDQELVARARQSYRKGLQDKNLFHNTLPCVAR